MDVLRVVAVAAIVWFHLGLPGAWIAYTGFPALLVMSNALPILRDDGQDFSDLVIRRSSRLLKPWLFWSAVYGVELIARAFKHGLDPMALFDRRMLVTGTSLHLWYLPFVFVESSVAVGLRRALACVPPEGTCVISTCFGWAVLALVSSHLGPVAVLGPSVGQWLPGEWDFGLAALPLGVATGVAMRIDGASVSRRWLTIIGAATCAYCFGIYALSHNDINISYGIGVPLFCASAFWKPRLNRTAIEILPLSFGIYLVHPLVGNAIIWLRLNQINDVAFGIVVTVFSAAFTWVALKTPLRRFLL
jgi:hypothetical protein